MILLSFLLGLAGLALMGLSQANHHGWALRRPARPLRMRRLRLAGMCVIALSLAPAMAGWGVAHGGIGWVGLLSLAAAVLILGRTFLPSPVKR